MFAYHYIYANEATTKLPNICVNDLMGLIIKFRGNVVINMLKYIVYLNKNNVTDVHVTDVRDGRTKIRTSVTAFSEKIKS